MKNTTERFTRVYNILLEAYFNGTLAAGNCAACAVNNIICNYKGIQITKEIANYIDNKGTHPSKYYPIVWMDVFGMGEIYENLPYTNTAKKDLERLLPYTVKELALIERTFEKNCKIKVWRYEEFSEQEILEDQFNGLSAVVDVLLELDNITPDISYNNKFKEHPKLQLV